MMGGEGPVSKELEVIEEHQILEVDDGAEPATLSELSTQVVEEMRMVGEAMYSVCSFHNIDL